MKKTACRLAVAVVGLLICAQSMRAEQNYQLGVGIIVGEPTGISVKKWISPEHAIDAAAAWSFSENDSFQFHMDYLIHMFGVLETDETMGRLPVYFGLGARVKFRDNDNASARNNDDALIGVRVPFGVCYLFAEVPVEIFAEIVPILDIAPDTDFDINVAVGARLYFQ